MTSSTERFSEAIQLTHSSSAAVSSQERMSAEQYLMDLRHSVEGLNLSFYIITNEPVNDLRYFWSFNTIKHHIPSIARTVDDQQANELYRSLFSFIHRYLFGSPSTSPADYVLNKHAQLMVVGLRHFFPNRWNSFFSDLFDLLERGRASPASGQDAAVTYFLRVFEYVDEQVVNVRDQVDRGREQRSLDMQIKDAMRESIIPRVVQTWFNVLNDSRGRASETANLCLSVVQTYVEWIDVTLVMTPDWMNLLYFLVTVPPVRVAACECLLSLVTKKQLTGMKLASLAALNVVEALPRLLSLLTVPPTSDEDVAFFDVVTRLSVAVGEQFLSLLEVCQGQLAAQAQGAGAPSTAGPALATSYDAAGAGVVQDRPYQLTPSLLEQLAASLHGSVTHLLRLLRVAPPDSCDTLLGFFQQYSKSAFMNMSETMQLLLAVFEMSKIRDIDEDDARIWDDQVIDLRRTLHTLFRLLHRRAPSLVFEYVYNLTQRLVMVWGQAAGTCDSVQPIHAVGRSEGSRLACVGSNSAPTTANNNNNMTSRHSAASGPLSTSASLRALSETDSFVETGGCENSGMTCDSGGSLLLHQMGSTLEAPQNFRDAAVVEATLRLVYEIGESAKLDILRDEKDGFTQMIAQIISCEPLVGTAQLNSGVHLTFFELIDRYVVFFQFHSELLPVLLHRLLLLPGGVMNRNDRVRTRIDYLFSHLLQVLRMCLSPYAADMVTALQSILASTDYLVANDRRQLFEAIGTLLSIVLDQSRVASSQAAGAATAAQASSASVDGNDEDAAQRLQYISAVMEALVNPVTESAVQLLLCCDRGDPSGGACNGLSASPPTTADTAVADAISYIGAIAKGLNSCYNTSASSPASAATATSGGSLQVSFQGAGMASVTAAGSSLHVAQRFTAVTEQVLGVMDRWHASAAVRDAVSQFFQQMVNTIPYDLLEPYYVLFVEQSLNWMESVAELCRLLRLMFQSVNKAGPRCTASVSRLTPQLWEKVAQVGTLDDAAPVVYMGVLSESARERVDMYRQLFTYVFNVATWGSGAGLLLLPYSCLSAVLQQLLAATALPTELELPRAALQTLAKVTHEVCGTSAALAQVLAGATAGDASAALNVHTLAELVRASPDPAAMQSQIKEAEAFCERFLLESTVPSVLHVLLAPSFNLSDAKNLSVAIGETAQLCKVLIGRLGDRAMQAVYDVLSPLVGADEAMGVCTALRDQPKLNSVLKIKFRDMLLRAQAQLAQSHASQ